MIIDSEKATLTEKLIFIRTMIEKKELGLDFSDDYDGDFFVYFNKAFIKSGKIILY
jgi:hypothetical protein